MMAVNHLGGSNHAAQRTLNRLGCPTVSRDSLYVRMMTSGGGASPVLNCWCWIPLEWSQGAT